MHREHTNVSCYINIILEINGSQPKSVSFRTRRGSDQIQREGRIRSSRIRSREGRIRSREGRIRSTETSRIRSWQSHPGSDPGKDGSDPQKPPGSYRARLSWAWTGSGPGSGPGPGLVGRSGKATQDQIQTRAGAKLGLGWIQAWV